MKDSQGGQYFHGKLTDDKGSMRVYDSGERKKLFQYYEKVKFAERTDALELEAGKSIDIGHQKDLMYKVKLRKALHHRIDSTK